MNWFTGLTLLIVSFHYAATTRYNYQQAERPTFPETVRVAVVEDHPWIIKNETCIKETPEGMDSSSCYYGFLKDLLFKIQEDLKFNFTILSFDEFGKLDESQSPPKWTGLIGAVASEDAHVGLAALNITEERKSVIDFTSPFESKPQEYEYALAFPKNSTLTPAFSHMIKKLVNQRHVEQLKERWFNESKDYWKKEKQLTFL